MNRIMIFLSTIAIYSCLPKTGNDSHAVKFEKEKWHTKDSVNENLRYEMIGDLMENVIKIGESKSDILLLLGDSEQPHNPNFAKSKNVLIYEVGTSGLDPCYLYLKFDEHDELLEGRVDCS